MSRSLPIWTSEKFCFVADGRKEDALQEFRWDLIDHGGDPDQIEELCMDMSAAYIAGAETSLPHAAITFDKFHVMKLLSEAIEKMRRQEQKTMSYLKGHRFAVLKNPENMRDHELAFASQPSSRDTPL